MRRDDMLVTTYEEAVQWLEEFGHTIADERVREVVALLQAGAAERIAEVEQELEDAEVSAETEIALQESKLEALEDAVEAFKSLHHVGCCCLGCAHTEAAMKIKEAS